jgi:hypothetical protein
VFEDHHPGHNEKSIAETVARAEVPETAPLIGTMALAESALNSPAPRADAEASSCNRALSAYEEARTNGDTPPSPPAAPGIASKLGKLVRRLRDRG